MTLDEVERELYEIILQLAKANGDEEKIFLAVEDLRAVTARVMELAKPIYDKVLAEAADAKREHDAAIAADIRAEYPAEGWKREPAKLEIIK